MPMPLDHSMFRDYCDLSESDEIAISVRQGRVFRSEEETIRFVREVLGMSPENDGYQVFHNLVDSLLTPWGLHPREPETFVPSERGEAESEFVSW